MAKGANSPNSDLKAMPRAAVARRPRPLQSPGDVLLYWFKNTAIDVDELQQRQRFWFQKSDATDREIAARGVDLLARLAAGEAVKWAAKGKGERLAAIIALDQFPRNIFRNSRHAFEQDELALRLCKEGLTAEDDRGLSPLKRWFFYLPLMHSESLNDQKLSVKLYKELLQEADDGLRPILSGVLNYAEQHRDVVKEFGRFPHRNKLLRRSSTKEEKAYLARPGSGF